MNAVCLLYFVSAFTTVYSHGLMSNPPGRNTIWKEGFPNPANYDDNGLNCGGLSNQWDVNDGKCGVCGDPYQGPLKHQAGYPGGYANGIIGRIYKQGDVVEMTAKITANHLGQIMFKICPVNDKSKRVTQDCFDKYPLSDAKGREKFDVFEHIGYSPGIITVSLQLPAHLTCSQCVVQWTYIAGNNKGGEATRQETFQNCADVAITAEGGPQPKPEKLPGSVKRRAGGATKYNQIGESEGQWDCDVTESYRTGDEHQRIYDWCIENCIEIEPQYRYCPKSHCRCSRLSSHDNSRMTGPPERQTDSYPIQDNQLPQQTFYQPNREAVEQDQGQGRTGPREEQGQEKLWPRHQHQFNGGDRTSQSDPKRHDSNSMKASNAYGVCQLRKLSRNRRRNENLLQMCLDSCLDGDVVYSAWMCPVKRCRCGRYKKRF